MAKKATELKRFIVLPTRGLRATATTSAPNLANFLVNLSGVRSFAAAKKFVTSAGLQKTVSQFRVLDSIHEDGAKLVEMTEEAANDLKANEPGLRIVPEVFYKIARRQDTIETKIKSAATTVKTVISVVSAADNKPIAGAMVVAFTNFAAQTGAQGITNSSGQVKLGLGGAKKIERLYVYPVPGFWSGFRKSVSTTSAIMVKLRPVDLTFTDSLRHYYGNNPGNQGRNVTVGIVDTGVGPHPDLVVAGGLNTVGFNPTTGKTEAKTDFTDSGEMHGTHVAGIVAARGAPPTGLRGVAPDVTLRSYRVFGKNANGASNFAIAKAIDAATSDGCDLINLSLGGDDPDPATASAIHDARQAGCVVIAATGNDGRKNQVSFPGADSLCIAVTALGVVGTFPTGTVDELEVVKPRGTVDPKEFIADFSNGGSEVDLTGPGVGVLSTVPGGYMPMSGTSMATPAVVGFAATIFGALFVANPALATTRTQQRSDDLIKALLLRAQTRGFPATLEGSGLPH